MTEAAMEMPRYKSHKEVWRPIRICSPVAAGLRSLRLKHDLPMIHMRRGRRLEIAFVSYWEWAKLVATSLGLADHSRGFFALVGGLQVGRIS